jgi:hypothetical protein
LGLGLLLAGEAEDELEEESWEFLELLLSLDLLSDFSDLDEPEDSPPEPEDSPLDEAGGPCFFFPSLP